MSPIACACNKNRGTAAGAAAVSGTYRVMVNSRKVYESTNGKAAESVGERFSDAEINTPTGTTLKMVAGTWVEK